MSLLIPPSNPRGAHYHSPHFTDDEGEARESSDLPVATQLRGWTQGHTLAGGGGVGKVWGGRGSRSCPRTRRAGSVLCTVTSVVPSTEPGMA